MADGYGRMADEPAYTHKHLGPGLANGLANLHKAKIKEHTQNYFIDIREIIDMQSNNEKVESVYDFCKENFSN